MGRCGLGDVRVYLCVGVGPYVVQHRVAVAGQVVYVGSSQVYLGPVLRLLLSQPVYCMLDVGERPSHTSTDKIKRSVIYTESPFVVRFRC